LADQEAIALRRQLELDQELTQRVDSARKREQEARHRASQLRSELQDMAHSAVEPKLDMA
jgi:chaperonin cofactor prefoldin